MLAPAPVVASAAKAAAEAAAAAAVNTWVENVSSSPGFTSTSAPGVGSPLQHGPASIAVGIGAQAGLGILLDPQAIAALVAEAVSAVGHGTVRSPFSEQILMLAGVGRYRWARWAQPALRAPRGRIPVVDVGTGGVRRLGGGGRAAQDNEVAGLLARLFQKRRQHEVAGMQLILHIRPQALGVVVEVGVHPIVHCIVHMLQRRRPHIGIRVATISAL